MARGVDVAVAEVDGLEWSFTASNAMRTPASPPALAVKHRKGADSKETCAARSNCVRSDVQGECRESADSVQSVLFRVRAGWCSSSGQAKV